MKKKLYCDIANLTNSGHINVATTASWALTMVSELVPILKKKYPETSIELLEGNLVPTEQLLAEKKIDLAFVAINSLQNIPGSHAIGLETACIGRRQHSRVRCAYRYGYLEQHLPDKDRQHGQGRGS